MLNMVDQGQVSKMTQGQINEVFTEVGSPPWNKWHGCCIGATGENRELLKLEPDELTNYKDGIEGL